MKGTLLRTTLRKVLLILTVLSVSLTAFAQGKITVSGKVIDKASSEPLIGVSVIEKGTMNGSITAADGSYSLNVSPDAVLLFSCMGFKDVEVAASAAPATVSMAEDENLLEETVVVGYGTQKKVNLTGAVSVVKGEDIAARPSTNAISAIMGAMPGVAVSRSGGKPGSEGTGIEVRGATSVNSTSVLVLIDGVEGNLSLINPQDIESISVLKDAAAAAIYGARAASGVILVTTKTGGDSQSARINYNGYYSVLTPTHMLSRLNAGQEQDMINLSRLNANGSVEQNPEWSSWTYNPNFNYRENGSRWEYFGCADWLNEGLSDFVSQQNHAVSISGGNKDINYLVSGSYFTKNGILKYGPDDYNRMNLRAKINAKVNNYVDVNVNADYINGKTRTNSWGAESILEGLYTVRNRQSVYNYDAYAPSIYNFDLQSNLIQVEKEAGANITDLNSVVVSGGTRIHDIIKGVELVANASRRVVNNVYSSEKHTIIGYGLRETDPYRNVVNSENSFQRYMSNAVQDKLEAYLSYTNTFAGKHYFHAMAGTTYENYRFIKMDNTVKHLTYDNLFSLNYYDSTVPTNTSISDTIQEWAMDSFFGRINYSYADKYLFEANARYDGSSRLAPENRWALFPSFSAGWRIDKEDWFNVRNISNLKLRASWGQLGNGAVLGYYDYFASINSGTTIAGDGNAVETTMFQNTLAARDKSWEIITTTDVGLDLGLFGGKFNLSADYFWKLNSNMLAPVSLPSTIGVTTSNANIGELKTWGWEFEANWKDSIGSDFFYQIGLNMSDSKNKLISYSGYNTVGEGIVKFIEGYPLNTIWGYKTDGFWQSRDEYLAFKEANPGFQSFQDAKVGAGDTKFLPQPDKDGKLGHTIGVGNAIPGDSGDLVYLGDTTPHYLFGINLAAQWKGFDFRMLLQGVMKRTILYDTSLITAFNATSKMPLAYQLDYWTEDNPNAYLPRPMSGQTYNGNAADRWTVNAGYLRLKNFQIGYTVPVKRHIQNLRIYISGEDVMDFSNILPGFDPEAGSATGKFSRSYYPYFATWAFGVNLTL